MQQAHEEKRGETRARIIQAAKDVFAEQGFAGARVDEIARRAQVNKAALYYHIGDKQALYGEVLHDVIGTNARRLAADMVALSEPEEKFRAYFATLREAIGRNPQMPRIMMREMASDGINLPDVFFQDLDMVLKIVTDMIEEGVKRGVFIDTIPIGVHLIVISTLIFLQVSGPIFLDHPKTPKSLKKIDKAFLPLAAQELERLILRALKR